MSSARARISPEYIPKRGIAGSLLLLEASVFWGEQCGFSNGISQWIDGREEATQVPVGIYCKTKMTLHHQK